MGESYQPLLKEISIDDVINEIGSGKFHYKMIILGYYLNFLQVSQCALPGIILPSITNEFNASKSEVSLYGTFEFLGYFISSIIIGTITNKLGRKFCIILFQTIWLLTFLISILATNIYVFSILRCIVSISFMCVILSSFSIISEICPQKTRSFILNFIAIIVSFAYLGTNIIGKLIFSDLKTANWRALFLIYSILLAISLVLNYFFYYESPRYDLFFGKRERAFKTLETMALENLNKRYYLNEEKKQAIERWTENFTKELSLLLEEKKSHKGNFFSEYMQLFKGNYKRITLIMFAVWTVISSTTFGTEFVLPTILSKITNEGNSGEDPLTILAYLNLAVGPGMVPLILMVESVYFGRKRTLSIIFFAMGVGSTAVYFRLPYKYFWIYIYKLGYHSAFSIIYLFTSELYPTKLRINALGQSSAFSRIGVMLMVWIAVFLVDIDPLLPFLIYGLMGFFAFFVMGLLQYDTYNEDIDRLLEK